MKKVILFTLAFFFTTTFLFSQGSDAANNAAYGSGWSNSSNGGSGFGAWSFSTSGSAGMFKGSSTANGDGDSNSNGDIDTDGNAWGLWANGGGVSSAVRNFATAMVSNDRFSLQMDNGWVDNGSTVGFGLRNSSGENLMEFYFVGGQTGYTIADATTTLTSIGFTDEGLTILIELTATSTYDLKVIPVGTTDTTTFSSRTLKNPTGGQSISQLRLFNANAGNNNPRNLYFNSISHSVDVLPVELSAFKALAAQSSVLLQWTTASELNNAGFEVERSTNGKDFKTIGNVSGAGNSFEAVHYEFADNTPANGINYYRLRQVDFDGAFEYSNIVTADFQSRTSVRFFPNPTTDRLTVQVSNSGNFVVRIFTLNGQLVREMNVSNQDRFEVEVADFQAGIYQLDIRTADLKSTVLQKTFVKQ